MWFKTIIMMCGVFLVVVTFVVLISKQSAANDGNFTGPRVTSSLKFLVIVARHGNRGGIMDYVLDPYPLKDAKYWPYGSNNLTPYGRVQMYNLGRKIRSMYDGFLNASFNLEELRASSTPKARTMQSGLVFLAGLYPPEEFQVWNKDILWQPIPLFSDSPDNSQVTQYCPRYVVDCIKGREEYFKNNEKNISEIIQIYNESTGANATNSMIWALWDKLVSEEIEGYKLPEWTESFYPEPLNSLIIKQYYANNAGADLLKRLSVGNLMGEILDAMESKMNGKLKDRKLQFYSGHDSTIIPLLVMLGVPQNDLHIVKPGSAIVLELHQDSSTNEYTVQALYIDGSSSQLEPRLLPTPVCGDPCIYQQLQNNTKKYTRVNFDQECKTLDALDSLKNPYS